VARVYNSQGEVSLFLEEENLVHAEHFRSEHFVSELAYLSDRPIFEKFITLNTRIQGNDANITVVTDKVKIFIRNLGL
jgi:hypothetical protein